MTANTKQEAVLLKFMITGSKLSLKQYMSLLLMSVTLF